MNPTFTPANLAAIPATWLNRNPEWNTRIRTVYRAYWNGVKMIVAKVDCVGHTSHNRPRWQWWAWNAETGQFWTGFSRNRTDCAYDASLPLTPPEAPKPIRSRLTLTVDFDPSKLDGNAFVAHVVAMITMGFQFHGAVDMSTLDTAIDKVKED